MRIIRVKVSRPAFFGFISSGHFGMRAQIVSKGDVTLDVGRICLEKVKLNNASTGLIVTFTIAPSRYAQLAEPIVAERLDAPTFPIEVGQIGDQRYQIEDRLGRQPWHRRRADMMDGHKDRAEDAQLFCVAGRHLRPSGIIGGYDDWNRNGTILGMRERKFN